MNKAFAQQWTDDAQQKQNRETRAARCPACQLQLCKSREAAPHAGLVEATGDAKMRGADRAFTCQTCGITLVNSADTRKPGWTQGRQPN